MPKWLVEGDFRCLKHSPFLTQALSAHMAILRQKGDFARMLAALEGVYFDGFCIHTFGDVFPVLLGAVGYWETGQTKAARELISCALDFLLPDEIFNQLVVYDSILKGFVRECIAWHAPESLCNFDREKNRMAVVFAAVYPDCAEGEAMEQLTEREYDIAMLAARGMSNEQIAVQLFLTVNTVRAHLRAVFKKIKIERRSQLFTIMQQRDSDIGSQ